jgi:CubicO group peptidase (beta-lactamase class C family)
MPNRKPTARRLSLAAPLAALTLARLTPAARTLAALTLVVLALAPLTLTTLTPTALAAPPPAPPPPAAAPKLDPNAAAQAGMDAERLARIAPRMQAFVDAHTAAGFVTLVARRGRLVTLDAVGVQDLDTRAPMREDSIFQIASMTKPITAAAVMMLMEEGKLAITDPVEKHLPEFRGQWMVDHRDGDTALALKRPPRLVTLYDLLTHTSGMAGGFPAGLSDIFQRRQRTLAEAVAAYSQQPLEFEPGARWRYSNMGIATLGRIIEVVSGMPYEQFLARRIFEPLGMNDSFFFPPEDKYARIASVYDTADGKLVKADIDLYRKGAKYPAPEGGLYSTAPDLLRFYQMMLNGGALDGKRLLSKSAVEVMTQVHTGELEAGFAPGMGYGLAWSVVRSPQGIFRGNSVGAYGHGGAYRTYGFIDPRKELIGIILYQRVSGGGDLADEINAFIALANAAITD